MAAATSRRTFGPAPVLISESASTGDGVDGTYLGAAGFVVGGADGQAQVLHLQAERPDSADS